MSGLSGAAELLAFAGFAPRGSALEYAPQPAALDPATDKAAASTNLATAAAAAAAPASESAEARATAVVVGDGSENVRLSAVVAALKELESRLKEPRKEPATEGAAGAPLEKRDEALGEATCSAGPLPPAPPARESSNDEKVAFSASVQQLQPSPTVAASLSEGQSEGVSSAGESKEPSKLPAPTLSSEETAPAAAEENPEAQRAGGELKPREPSKLVPAVPSCPEVEAEGSTRPDASPAGPPLGEHGAEASSSEDTLGDVEDYKRLQVCRLCALKMVSLPPPHHTFAGSWWRWCCCCCCCCCYILSEFVRMSDP